MKNGAPWSASSDRKECPGLRRVKHTTRFCRGTQSLSGYTPNNSLDRSGGSVFLNMNGAAMVG